MTKTSTFKIQSLRCKRLRTAWCADAINAQQQQPEPGNWEAQLLAALKAALRADGKVLHQHVLELGELWYNYQTQVA